MALTYTCESLVIEMALEKLKEAGLVMERLLYMLSSVRRPRRVIGLGTYCGNALVWLVGLSCGQGGVYEVLWPSYKAPLRRASDRRWGWLSQADRPLYLSAAASASCGVASARRCRTCRRNPD